MFISPDATASFYLSSLGESWAGVDVMILEFRWKFIAEYNGQGIAVLANYTGHRTSTTTGNYVVLYMSSGYFGSTNGLLKQVDIESPSEILDLLKTHGWHRA